MRGCASNFRKFSKVREFPEIHDKTEPLTSDILAPVRAQIVPGRNAGCEKMLKNVLRREAVEKATGLPRSTLYDLIGRGEFPEPIPLGRRAVGWLETEVQEWVHNCAAKRESASTDKGGRKRGGDAANDIPQLDARVKKPIAAKERRAGKE